MRVIIIILLFTCTVRLSAQTPNEKNYNFYTEQYKLSKKKGNKLLIIGGSSIAAGVLLAVIPTKNTYSELGKTIGGISLISGGTIISIISIPFYVTAFSHKRNMKKLTSEITTTNLGGNHYTNIRLKLTF